jgi:multicomponent K+:H+ antiporter subunit E
MRTWFPYPLLSTALFLMWLLLNQSVAPGTILIGLILSMVLACVMVKLQPPRSHIRRLRRIAVFGLYVVADITRSNVVVARIILRARRQPVTSGFVAVDFDVEDENALALLACILTATPGTAWLEYDRPERKLLLHILDMENEAAWRRTLERYEASLKEIFQ